MDKEILNEGGPDTQKTRSYPDVLESEDSKPRASVIDLSGLDLTACVGPGRPR